MASTTSIDTIAKRRITRPASVERLPKFHIYGRNKKGKTHFISTAGVEDVLYLDPEHGTDRMKAKNPHVWPVDRWEDVQEYYDFLRHGTHNYRWGGIDGCTKLSNMALRYVMKRQEELNIDRQPGFVQKQDYGKAGELMKQMINNFHNLPMGIVFTSQERQIEGADSEEDEDSEDASTMYVPDLPKGVRSAINSVVDVIGRIYVVSIDTDDGEKKERRLWIGESDKYDTGYRSDYQMPAMLRNPTIPKLERLINTGRATKPKTA